MSSGLFPFSPDARTSRANVMQPHLEGRGVLQRTRRPRSPFAGCVVPQFGGAFPQLVVQLPELLLERMVGGLKALPSGYVAEVLLVGLLGIVFVMTTKSSLTASLLVMAGAVALGLVSC